MDDDIIAAVDAALPRFNEHLLNDYPNQQVDEIKDFLSMAFNEAMKFLRNLVKYEGYRILSPEERVHFEITQQRMGGAPITSSELILVAFDFLYEEKRHTAYLYLPYMIDGVLTIRNTKYAIMYGITEKIFSKGPGGITVRVIRQALHFWRSHHFMLQSVTSDYRKNEFIVGAKLHTRDSRRKNITTTITHYFLSKFGMNGTLRRFGMDPQDLKFVKKIGNDTGDYEYFVAIKQTKQEAAQNDPTVYMKVSKSALQDPTFSKLAANVCYILSKRNNHTVESLYDRENTTFLVYLGELLYGPIGDGMAKSQADTHMHSVDFFLDPTTRDRLSAFGVEVSDIWDLVQYIFTEIDRILVTSTHQNLYEKRIVLTDLFVIETFTARMYRRVYTLDQNPRRLDSKELAKLINLKPTGIRGISRAPNVEMVGTSIINGNRLLSFGLRRIRLSGAKTATPTPMSPDARFDPSIAVVETLIGFAGKSASVTGLMNPYAQVDPRGGGILRPDSYADEIDALAAYLPH